MKSLHGVVLGEARWKRRIRVRDVDKSQRSCVILAAIMPDFRPAQRTGAIKVYRGFRHRSLHLYRLKIGPIS
jgi:hypothetical protein